MRVTPRGWRRYAAIYRTLVVAQTLGWAISGLARAITRHAASTLNAQPIAVALAAGSVVGIVAGVITYYLRRTQSRDRDAVILAWAWFQLAGFLALTGYAITAAALCFVAGIATLVAMHAFSPNRFQAPSNG